jgi:hypothetical protein
MVQSKSRENRFNETMKFHFPCKDEMVSVFGINQQANKIYSVTGLLHEFGQCVWEFLHCQQADVISVTEYKHHLL